jgi:single-stranded-DNA-specific exonuclease
MQNKRWTLHEADEDRVQRLYEQLRVNRSLCKILVQRGYDNLDAARAYFRPDLSMLHSPWLMKDMDKAVQRIRTAFSRKEKILIFGDYDVDGTTSVACMVRFLSQVYDPSLIEFYIPNRYREGYGVSQAGIDFAFENDFRLIISVDCGIKSIELVDYARSKNIDFVICDHHLPDKSLPAAVAILNTKQEGCAYPYKELCGCGVAFKLITAISESLNLNKEQVYQYLDLVAAAIAADIVPVTGENRVLAYYGLKKINSDPCAGLKALMKLAKVEKEYCFNNVVFIIAPRVNAAGRMDDARKAVQLFITDDPGVAMGYAEMLHVDNTARKETDLTITEQALSMIESNNLISRKSTVLFREDWHKGVVGIVASRLIEKYHRPTVVLTRSGDVVAGSARSIRGFNLYEAIHACRQHLLGYGGHFAAAGLTMSPDEVEAFTEKFEQTVCEQCEPHFLIPEIQIDAEISFADISEKLFNIMKQMEPFGPENMRPVFVARGVVDTGHSRILKENHLRFVVKQNGTTLTGIGFNLSAKFDIVQSKEPFDLVFTIDLNEWNGSTSIQLKVMDLRESSIATPA